MAGSSAPPVIRGLQSGQKLVNLVAVVTTFRPPAKSRGKDYFCFLELVDESEKDIKCMIFGSESSLPQACPPGTVVCLRRVEVVEYQGRPQLQCHSKLGYWAVLSERGNGSVCISSSNDDLVNLSDVEKQRGRTLKEWAGRTNLISDLPKLQPGSVCSTTHLPSAAGGPSLNTILSKPSLSSPTDGDAPSTMSTSSTLSKSLPFGGRVCPPKSIRNYGVGIKRISEFSAGMRNVGVCGVVKHFKPPIKSKGRDFYTVVHIVDKSSPSIGLTCIIFNPSKDKLPFIGKVGAVVLIKGVRIEASKETDHIQAMGHEHTLVGVFSGEMDDVIEDQIGSWYDLSTPEKKRVEELKLWSKSEGPLLLSTKMGEVIVGHFVNLVCQVLAMAVLEDEKRAVLSVLDGSSPKVSYRELDLLKSKKRWEFDSVPEKFFLYRQLTQDVWVSNIDELDAIAGDVVHMINVECFQKPTLQSTAADTDTGPIELRIMERHSGVVHLEYDSKEALKFKESIPTMVGALPAWSDRMGVVDENCIIATIVNESTPLATLKEIREANEQCEYLVDAQVNPGALNDTCVPHCPLCHDKCLIEGETNCQKDGTVLEYELSFVLHLEDETGELEVLVRGQESRKLLSKVFADNFVACQANKTKIMKVLRILTGVHDPCSAVPSDPRYVYSKPNIQCAVMKVFNPTTSDRLEQSCSYYLVNTVIDLQ